MELAVEEEDAGSTEGPPEEVDEVAVGAVAACSPQLAAEEETEPSLVGSEGEEVLLIGVRSTTETPSTRADEAEGPAKDDDEEDGVGDVLGCTKLPSMAEDEEVLLISPAEEEESCWPNCPMFAAAEVEEETTADEVEGVYMPLLADQDEEVKLTVEVAAEVEEE